MFHLKLEIERMRNINKNVVTEKANGELEELLRQDPSGTQVSELSLTGATSPAFAFTGLFAREL